jgi:hypothetical protein
MTSGKFHGLAARVSVDATTLRAADRNVDRRAFDLRGPTRHVTEIVACAGHIDDAGHLLCFAVVDALELRELVGVLVDEIGQAPDQRLAMGRQHRRPGSTLEGLSGRRDGLVHVGAARVGNRSDLFARRRIDHWNAVARGGLHPLTADQQPRRPSQERCDAGGGRWLGSNCDAQCNSPI